MTINTYRKGQKVRCVAGFAVSGMPTDPTTVTAKVKKPSGTVTTYVYGTDAALVKDSTGNYHIDVTSDEKSEWNFRFEGTGTCAAVEEQAFNVTTVF